MNIANANGTSWSGRRVMINEAVGKVFVNARIGARTGDLLLWAGTREDEGGGGCSEGVVSDSGFDAKGFSLLDGSGLAVVWGLGDGVLSAEGASSPPSPPIDPLLPTCVISVPSLTATKPCFLSPSSPCTRR